MSNLANSWRAGVRCTPGREADPDDPTHPGGTPSSPPNRSIAISMRAVLFIVCLLSFGARPHAVRAETGPTGPTPEVRSVRVPGTTVKFDLVRVPGSESEGVPTVLRTEVPWELYDVFVYGLDRPDAGGADAVARPSKPYVPPDRGFGHQGYPAMGMTRQAAESFCAWLSGSTGIAFRLPTQAEWSYMAGPAPEDHAAAAWSAENAGFTTHPVGRLAPNAFGLHDMLGNVAEWVSSASRLPVAMGGSYRDGPTDCHAAARAEQDRSWNASDPQIPKSRWWLADCSWVGFRFVTEDDVRQEPRDDQ
jgi:hypothetical protein